MVGGVEGERRAILGREGYRTGSRSSSMGGSTVTQDGGREKNCSHEWRRKIVE